MRTSDLFCVSVCTALVLCVTLSPATATPMGKVLRKAHLASRSAATAPVQCSATLNPSGNAGHALWVAINATSGTTPAICFTGGTYTGFDLGTRIPLHNVYGIGVSLYGLVGGDDVVFDLGHHPFGVVNSGFDVVINGINFVNGSSSNNGGVLLFTGGSSATISNCSFANSHSTGMGGVFAVTNNSSLSVYETVFISNSAPKGGVGFCMSNTICSFYNASFIENSATTHGGAIFQEPNSNGLYDDCSFFMNAVAAEAKNAGAGGCVFSDSAGVYVNGGQFDSNTAIYGLGGGIAGYPGSVVDVTGTVFSANTAAVGGAMYSWGSVITLIEVTGKDGSATAGGFMTADSGTTLTSESSTYSYNTASVGAVIHVWVSVAEFSYDTFSSNIQGPSPYPVYYVYVPGAAVANVDNSSVFTCQYCTMSGNQAAEPRGVVLFAGSNSAVSIVNSQISGSFVGAPAPDYAASAVFVNHSEITAVSSAFQFNDGTAVVLAHGASGDMTDMFIAGNTWNALTCNQSSLTTDSYVGCQNQGTVEAACDQCTTKSTICNVPADNTVTCSHVCARTADFPCINAFTAPPLVLEPGCRICGIPDVSTTAPDVSTYGSITGTAVTTPSPVHTTYSTTGEPVGKKPLKWWGVLLIILAIGVVLAPAAFYLYPVVKKLTTNEYRRFDYDDL